MMAQFEIILIFSAVLVGVVSAAYFYLEIGIFMDALKKPLKYIAAGIFIISLGVLLAAVITYEAKQGLTILLGNIPLQAYFYILYIIGCLLIAVGASKFAHRPKEKVVDVSLQFPR